MARTLNREAVDGSTARRSSGRGVHVGPERRVSQRPSRRHADTGGPKEVASRASTSAFPGTHVAARPAAEEERPLPQETKRMLMSLRTTMTAFVVLVCGCASNPPARAPGVRLP